MGDTVKDLVNEVDVRVDVVVEIVLGRVSMAEVGTVGVVDTDASLDEDVRSISEVVVRGAIVVEEGLKLELRLDDPLT